MHYILLMECFCGSPENFLTAEPENEPYGKGPWPCVNKLCPFYGKDSARRIWFAYINGKIRAQFQCSYCGMKYQRSNPEQEFQEYANEVIILEYGSLWYDTLRDCVEVNLPELSPPCDT